MAVTRLTPRRRIMVEAAQAGIPPWWIAYELGITVKAVQVVLAQERGKGEVVPKFPHGIGWAAKRTKDAEASFYDRVFHKTAVYPDRTKPNYEIESRPIP